jgi:hypothetical protein
MSNNWKDYEKLTKQIFEGLLTQDRVKTLNIQHDVELQGKTTKHQVDVYWEFEAGGITYRTAVQAKDWSNPVDQGELIKFKGVLDDLPNQTRGVFVTRTGFQKGALEFANGNGIALYELRKPKDEDWEGSIRVVQFEGTFFAPSFSIADLKFDMEWSKQEKMRLGIPTDERIDIPLPTGLQMPMLFYDENGNQILDNAKLTELLIPEGAQELASTRRSHIFESPTFIRTKVARFPSLKILSMEVIVEVSKHVEEFKVDALDFIGFILKNVIDGTQQRFGPNGESL